MADHSESAPTINKCSHIFSNSTSNLESPQTQTINSLESFAQEMTQGLLLHPHQEDLFEVYRLLYFGAFSSNYEKKLSDVNNELAPFPELEKPHFQEFEITKTVKIYEATPELLKYIKSQIQTSGQVRSNLFQIKANGGYWKKLLDYEDPKMPEGLSKEEQKKFNAQAKERFDKYLQKMISVKNQELLANLQSEEYYYTDKTRILFATLKHLQEWMDKKGRNTQAIRQAMVDLVHNVAYLNPAIISLLKSKNAQEQIEALSKILDERDSMALELGYNHKFKGLQESLGVDYVTGYSKNEDPHQQLEYFNDQLQTSSFISQKIDPLRVRSLTIQESPMRSCLGGDCSTRSYFEKALDPNYFYFTLTDVSYNSRGHVTVVLGQAKNSQTGKLENVAFLDKIQSVPNQLIILFLQAINESLHEKGYVLGVPEYSGGHNGLSNEDGIRYFIDQEIVPNLKIKLKNYTPHKSEYKFKNSYSRAYEKLNLRMFDIVDPENNSEIIKGSSYEPHYADPEIGVEQLVKELNQFKNSNNPDDIVKYILMGKIVSKLQQVGAYSEYEFELDLRNIIQNKEIPFNIRKRTVFELLLYKYEIQRRIFRLDLLKIPDHEMKQIVSEVKQWSKTNDPRRKNFMKGLGQDINFCLNQDKPSFLKFYLDVNLIDINSRDQSNMSLFLKAVVNHKRNIVNWLLQDPKLDLSYRDQYGFTDIENAKLLGAHNLAEYIETIRPEAKGRDLKIKLRNSDGNPIMDFVKIHPGEFMMGQRENLYLVKLTKPFELMSVPTTQQIWSEVLDLGDKYLLQKVHLKKNIIAKVYHQTMSKVRSQLKSYIGETSIPKNPSLTKGSQYPVDSVSFKDVTEWFKVLNQLSQIEDANLQSQLALIFPEHQLGDHYRLPTDAEWEFVIRKRGSVIGGEPHGMTAEELKNVAWFEDNSFGHTQPVGKKQPHIINGKPIYDLIGNINEWVSDFYMDDVQGGIDPQGPLLGLSHVVRGFNYLSGSSDMMYRTDRRGKPTYVRNETIGFRIVRSKR
jgi:formylglycine-generating enzyme required for sulfatase activity